MNVTLSKHSWERWQERIDLKLTKKKLCRKVKAALCERMKQGLSAHNHIGNKAYFIIYIGQYNDKLVFAVLTIESSWKVVTFVTHEGTSSLSRYLEKKKPPN